MTLAGQTSFEDAQCYSYPLFILVLHQKDVPLFFPDLGLFSLSSFLAEDVIKATQVTMFITLYVYGRLLSHFYDTSFRGWLKHATRLELRQSSADASLEMLGNANLGVIAKCKSLKSAC